MNFKDIIPNIIIYVYIIPTDKAKSVWMKMKIMYMVESS